jgi:hypothetical protein
MNTNIIPYQRRKIYEYRYYPIPTQENTALCEGVFSVLQYLAVKSFRQDILALIFGADKKSVSRSSRFALTKNIQTSIGKEAGWNPYHI